MGHKWSSVSQLGYRYCTNCQVKMDGTSKLLACPPFTEDEANALNNAADQSHVCPKCKIEFVTRMPKCPICYHRKKSADQSRVIEVLRERLNELPREVPTNWIDPLLSGENAVVKTSDNREIEALLRGIQDRQRGFAANALAEAQRILEGK